MLTAVSSAESEKQSAPLNNIIDTRRNSLLIEIMRYLITIILMGKVGEIV